MHRSEVESDLEFSGFIIFENKLKPSSKGVISELHQAGIRNVMCTGDNILTAVSVARECGFIQESAQCFVPYFTEGRKALSYVIGRGSLLLLLLLPGSALDPNSRLCWESANNPEYQLDENTLTVWFCE